MAIIEIIFFALLVSSTTKAFGSEPIDSPRPTGHTRPILTTRHYKPRHLSHGCIDQASELNEYCESLSACISEKAGGSLERIYLRAYRHEAELPEVSSEFDISLDALGRVKIDKPTASGSIAPDTLTKLLTRTEVAWCNGLQKGISTRYTFRFKK